MPVVVTTGGWWGDEGKGKIVSYMTLKDKINVAVRVGSVNAGHTVVFNNRKYKLRLVPCAFVYNKCRLFIGPGANVNPEVFFSEIENMDVKDRVWVDYQSSIIEKEHIERDKGSELLAKKIGTTGQGVGPAVEDRVKRVAKMAREIPSLKPYLSDVTLEVNKAIARGDKVLLEGTQGFYLSLYHGTYPYVTSRDTSSASVCGEAGVPPTKIDDVLLVFKAYVTRVGGGPLPGELPEEEARKRGWVEIATVTGRMRRAAPFNYELARRAAIVNGATQLAITKIDVLFPECTGVKRFDKLSRRAVSFIKKIEREVKVPVKIISTGPSTMDTVDRRVEAT